MGRNEFGENNVTLSLYEAKPTAEQQAFLGELHVIQSSEISDKAANSNGIFF